MIEAIVLGSGTSNGVPSLGKRYPDRFLRDPRNHRTRTSLVLKSRDGNVLIDCAPEMRLQLLREGILSIDAVILTHTHADHIMGMDDLRSFSLRKSQPMLVYAWPTYQEDVMRVFAYAFKAFPDGIEVPRFKLKELRGQLNLCGMSLEVLKVDHGPWPVAAVRVGGFAYVTDVGNIPETAWNRLLDLDYLILDAVRLKPHPNHFHLEKAIEVAKDLRAKRVFFTHLSHDYDHATTNQELPPGVQLAYDGLRIIF